MGGLLRLVDWELALADHRALVGHRVLVVHIVQVVGGLLRLVDRGLGRPIRQTIMKWVCPQRNANARKQQRLELAFHFLYVFQWVVSHAHQDRTLCTGQGTEWTQAL